MKIGVLQIETSPRNAGLVRLSVRVEYQHRGARPETVWFEVPRGLAPETSRNGNPWLLALFPLAMVLGEEIHLDPLPVDGRLVANLGRVMAIWSRWYPELGPIQIEADRLPLSKDTTPEKTGLFFSGGVDSFYSLIHDREEAGQTIDELILIHGVDIDISNDVAFANAQAAAAHVADSFGLRLVTIGTNVRSTLLQLADWNLLAFGAVLAAGALVLEPHFTKCLIPSTGRQGIVPPLGSHPDTDPLLSTSRTRFIHHGGWMDRVGKIKLISEYPIALNNLRVCWNSDAGGNCSRCGKCLRTMTPLEILGKLASCPTFDHDVHLNSRIRRLYLSQDLPYMLSARDFAAERGRADIVEAIEAALRRTERLNRWLAFDRLLRIRRKLARNLTARRYLGKPYASLRRMARRVVR
jgi:hypothetical protein